MSRIINTRPIGRVAVQRGVCATTVLSSEFCVPRQSLCNSDWLPSRELIAKRIANDCT